MMKGTSTAALKYLTPKDVEQLIHSKIEEHSKGRGNRDALKLFGLSPDSVVDILTFKRVLERFGVVLCDSELREFFKRYDTEDTGSILLAKLLPKDYPSEPWFVAEQRQRKRAVRASGNTAGASSEDGARYSARAMEVLLRDKIMERGRSSKEPIRHAFQLFGRPRDGIDFKLFCETLQRMGVPLSEDQMRSLFARYDQDGSGIINFYEFARGVMPADYPKNSMLRQLSDEGDQETNSHAAKMEEFRLRTQSSMDKLSTTWKWSHDAIREIIQRKILERGGSSKDLLRQAFFLFGRPVDGVTVDVFKSTLKGFGIPATDAELEEMFRRFDDDKSGRLNFHEFARNVMPQDYIGESLYRGFQDVDDETARKARVSKWKSKMRSGAPNIKLVPAERRFSSGPQPLTATSLTLATVGSLRFENQISKGSAGGGGERCGNEIPPSSRGRVPALPSVRSSRGYSGADLVPPLPLSSGGTKAAVVCRNTTGRSGLSLGSNLSVSSRQRSLLAKLEAQERMGPGSGKRGKALQRLKRDKKFA